MSASLSPQTLIALARVAVESGGRAKLAIRGGSMRPTVREPMTIEVAALPGPARVGEILVFRFGDVYVAHRVVRRSGARYVTSGDAQPEIVESVDPADVLGRVEAVWSDASAGAVRVDTLAHRLRGLLYARGRPARLVVRSLAGRLARLRRVEEL